MYRMDQADPMEREAGARALALRVHQSRLVLFDEESDLLVIWNGSETFNVVALTGEDVGVFSEDVERNPDKARRAIEDHMAGWRS